MLIESEMKATLLKGTRYRTEEPDGCLGPLSSLEEDQEVYLRALMPSYKVYETMEGQFLFVEPQSIFPPSG